MTTYTKLKLARWSKIFSLSLEEYSSLEKYKVTSVTGAQILLLSEPGIATIYTVEK